MIVILNNIRSLYNVGSIFRTADAAGCEKIYLCGITPAPVDIFGKPRQQLTKISLGAERYIKWEKVRVTGKLISELKKSGYKIFVIEQNKKSTAYYKISKNYLISRSLDKIVIVVGNEIKGLPASILKRADKILEIPMRGAMVRQAHHPRHVGRGKESLNVSVAFGIVIFHLINS